MLPEPYLRSWQQPLASGERVVVYVADFEGKAIGFASGGEATEGGGSAETGEVWTLYLLRQFWGRGIGRRLHDT